ncbi:50S ribosomal protein L19 [bacterium]|nr:50S ribosomal protein L19 [bacterium]
MSDQILQDLERRELKTDIPDFGPGDTVSVHVRIVEGGKERIQVFKGTVMGRSGRGMRASFTVRKIGAGAIGVERVFPLHSPSIAKIDVDKRGDVRRAKIYYLRDRVGKAARVKEKVKKA